MSAPARGDRDPSNPAATARFRLVVRCGQGTERPIEDSSPSSPTSAAAVSAARSVVRLFVCPSAGQPLGPVERLFLMTAQDAAGCVLDTIRGVDDRGGLGGGRQPRRTMMRRPPELPNTRRLSPEPVARLPAGIGVRVWRRRSPGVGLFVPDAASTGGRRSP